MTELKIFTKNRTKRKFRLYCWTNIKRKKANLFVGKAGKKYVAVKIYKLKQQISIIENPTLIMKF